MDAVKRWWRRYLDRRAVRQELERIFWETHERNDMAGDEYRW